MIPWSMSRPDLMDVTYPVRMGRVGRRRWAIAWTLVGISILTHLNILDRSPTMSLRSSLLRSTTTPFFRLQKKHGFRVSSLGTSGGGRRECDRTLDSDEERELGPEAEKKWQERQQLNLWEADEAQPDEEGRGTRRAIQEERERLIARIAKVEKQYREKIRNGDGSWASENNLGYLSRLRESLEENQVKEGAPGSEPYRHDWEARRGFEAQEPWRDMMNPTEEELKETMGELTEERLRGKENVDWEIMKKTGIHNITNTELIEWSKMMDVCRKRDEEEFTPKYENTSRRTLALVEKGFPIIDSTCYDCQEFLIGPRKMKNSTMLPEAYCPSCNNFVPVWQGDHALPKTKAHFEELSIERDEELRREIVEKYGSRWRNEGAIAKTKEKIRETLTSKKKGKPPSISLEEALEPNVQMSYWEKQTVLESMQYTQPPPNINWEKADERPKFTNLSLVRMLQEGWGLTGLSCLTCQNPIIFRSEDFKNMNRDEERIRLQYRCFGCGSKYDKDMMQKMMGKKWELDKEAEAKRHPKKKGGPGEMSGHLMSGSTASVTDSDREDHVYVPADSDNPEPRIDIKTRVRMPATYPPTPQINHSNMNSHTISKTGNESDTKTEDEEPTGRLAASLNDRKSTVDERISLLEKQAEALAAAEEATDFRQKNLTRKERARRAKQELQYALMDPDMLKDDLDMDDEEVRNEVERREEQINEIKIFNYNFDRLEREKARKGEKIFDPVPVHPPSYYALSKEERDHLERTHESVVADVMKQKYNLTDESILGPDGGQILGPPTNLSYPNVTQADEESDFDLPSSLNVSQLDGTAYPAGVKNMKDPQQRTVISDHISSKWWEHEKPEFRFDPVSEWTKEGVLKWAVDSRFSPTVLEYLVRNRVDGDDLLRIREADIENDITNTLSRKQLLAQIAKFHIHGGNNRYLKLNLKHAGIYKVVGPVGAVVREDVRMHSNRIGSIAKGELVHVIETVGRRARIKSPMEGWVSVCTAGDFSLILEFVKHKKEKEPKFKLPTPPKTLENQDPMFQEFVDATRAYKEGDEEFAEAKFLEQESQSKSNQNTKKPPKEEEEKDEEEESVQVARIMPASGQENAILTAASHVVDQLKQVFLRLQETKDNAALDMEVNTGMQALQTIESLTDTHIKSQDPSHYRTNENRKTVHLIGEEIQRILVDFRSSPVETREVLCRKGRSLAKKIKITLNRQKVQLSLDPVVA